MRVLWTLSTTNGTVECLIISCCAGAELQLRRYRVPGETPAIELRELYPTKSDLYERARLLQAAHGG